MIINTHCHYDMMKSLRPQLIEQRDLLQVKLILSIERNSSFISSNGKKDGKKDDKIKIYAELTERQKLLLSYIKENDTITIPEMARKAKVSSTTISRDIAVLQNSILKREGGRKDGRWIVKFERN